MSKSKGNFYTLRDLISKGIDPRTVRYALQSVPYRRQLNFTFDVMKQAESSLKRLEDFQLRLRTEPLKQGSNENEEVQRASAAALQDFEKAMDDDLNTAEALAAVFNWVRDLNTMLSENALTEEDRQVALQTLADFNQVLELWRPEQSGLDETISNLIDQRTQARKSRNFALADQIRDEIYRLGYAIEDTKEGVRWKKR
jgi:cysteinyl-tRNA synthetase